MNDDTTYGKIDPADSRKKIDPIGKKVKLTLKQAPLLGDRGKRDVCDRGESKTIVPQVA